MEIKNKNVYIYQSTTKKKDLNAPNDQNINYQHLNRSKKKKK